MKAAASSWRVWIKRILSWRFRRASMTPLMPSPGMPKIVSIPQAWIVSTRMSAAVRAMVGVPPLTVCKVDPQGCGLLRRCAVTMGEAHETAVSDRHRGAFVLRQKRTLEIHGGVAVGAD